MRILVTNDDGWDSPGILALADVLSSFATVEVVAPDANRSASSNSLTVGRPIPVTHGRSGYHAVHGTPSDSVHVAVTALLPWRPDLVVSGINDGQNLGEDTVYSGTVGAALEGFLYNIPAVAFSLVDRGWRHLDSAAKVAADIVLQVYGKLPSPWLLNVNIPNRPYHELSAYQITRLGRRNPSPGVLVDETNDGREVYRIGPYGTIMDDGEGTDFYAINCGLVSVTPLQVDWTHYDGMKNLSSIFGDGVKLGKDAR